MESGMVYANFYRRKMNPHIHPPDSAPLHPGYDEAIA
jgi:hypothetical protein